MIGNPEKERKLLEKTYEDKLTVSRSVEKTENNITKSVFEQVYQNIPCALSFGGSRSGDKSKQSINANQIEYDAVIFASPDLVIQPGDELEILCCGRTFSMDVTGKVVICPTHQEIRVRERGLA